MRTGDWIQTYTGKLFYPLDPSPDDVCIEDIAHALSLTCRYNGACINFYSVAEHSILISQAMIQYGARDCLRGLMHDATEAYVSDVPRPVKHMLPDFQAMESRVGIAIAEHFDLGILESTIVKEYDSRILHNEKAENIIDQSIDWHLHPAGPLDLSLMFLSPKEAEAQFLERYEELELALGRRRSTAIPV